MRMVKTDDRLTHERLKSKGRAKRKSHYDKKTGKWKEKNFFRSIGDNGSWPFSVVCMLKLKILWY